MKMSTEAIVITLALVIMLAGVIWMDFFAFADDEVVSRTSHSAEQERAFIISLTDTSETHGMFSLGTGSIDEKPYFFFYQVTGPKSYKLNRVPADITMIYEDEENAPYIAATINSITLCNRKGQCVDNTVGTTYALHVPNGTIRRAYNLDTEMR